METGAGLSKGHYGHRIMGLNTPKSSKMLRKENTGWGIQSTTQPPPPLLSAPKEKPCNSQLQSERYYCTTINMCSTGAGEDKLQAKDAVSKIFPIKRKQTNDTKLTSH